MTAATRVEAVVSRVRSALTGGRHRGSLLLLLLGVWVWSSTVWDGDVDLDTPWLVFNNPILSTGSLDALPTLLWDMSPGARLTLGAEYLPVRDLTVLLDFALFGERWAGHHLHSVLWYLGAGLLFLSILERLLGEGLRAWLGAAIFLVMPVHVESVAWLASRKDVVSLFFVFLSIRLFLDRTAHPRRGLLALTLLLPAYWAKNTAIVLPAWLFVLDWARDPSAARRPRWWAGWLPWAALSAMGLVVTLSLGSVVAMYAEPRAEDTLGALSLQCAVLGRYAGMLLWPTELSVLYVEPPVGWGVEALRGLGVAAGLGVFALLSKERLVRLGVAWFFLALLPVSQLIPIQNLMADRYLLLPSAGLVLALAAGVPRRGHALWLLLALFCVGLQARWTLERIPVWRGSLALWQDLTEKQPLHPRGWTALSGAQTALGQPAAAEATLEAGLTALPGHPLLQASLATIRAEQGDPEAAVSHYQAALRADPKLRKAANNLAVLLRRQGRAEEAAAVARILVRQHPLYPEGWNTLGAILLDQRQFLEATTVLGQASALAPFDPTVTLNLAALAWLQGDQSEAARWWTETLRLDPDNATARAGLAQVRGP